MVSGPELEEDWELLDEDELEPEDIDDEDCADSDEVADELEWLDRETELEESNEEDDESDDSLEKLDDELGDDDELLEDELGEEDELDEDGLPEDETSLDAEVCDEELLPESLDDGLRLELLGPTPEPEEGVELEAEVSELSEPLEPDGKPLKLESEDELTGSIEDALE